MTYKSSVGVRGEELAVQYLVKSGYSVRARNFRVSHDEFDIIAEDEKYIVFVEVKTRAQTETNKRYGRPCMAVNYRKQQKLIRAAEEYLRRYKPGKQPRIDIIEVYLPSIRENTPIDISRLLPLDIRHLRNAVHK
ncbi:MAG: YraN family protein [Clostridia bacterium]|nr:YraN family protein [Clostridia bacterium]